MAQQYTRKAIRETFIQMISVQPLDKVTVKDIVTACQINRNTFYYYYQDIYAILDEIFQSEIQKVIEEYNDTLSWEDGCLLACRFAINNRKAIYNIYNSIQKDQLERYIYSVSGQVMERFVANKAIGISAAPSDIKLIAAFYQSALTAMVLNWIGGGMKQEPQQVIQRIGRLFDGNIDASLRRSAQLNDKW